MKEIMSAPLGKTDVAAGGRREGPLIKGWGWRMRPDELGEKLRDEGLQVLTVSPHRSDPAILLVYLHGNAGQWVENVAVEITRKVPGVIAVTESVHSRTILLVQIPEPRSAEEADSG